MSERKRTAEWPIRDILGPSFWLGIGQAALWCGGLSLAALTLITVWTVVT